MPSDPQNAETIRSMMSRLPLGELRKIVAGADRNAWTSAALQIAGDVLEARERSGETDRAIVCPMCGSAMRPGMVSVQASWLSLLVVGLSWVDCCFHDADGGQQKVIGSGGRRRGLRCTACGAVVIEGSTYA